MIREARRVVDAKRSRLRTKLERIVASANRRRPENQPKLTVDEAEKLAEDLVSSALARAQKHCAESGLPPVEVFAVVVMSNPAGAGAGPRRVGDWLRSRAMTSSAGLRLGIDLGGTKTEIVALDAEGRERVRRRIPTPAAEGYEAVIGAIVGLVEATERELGARGSVGVGTPGALSPATGLLRNSNTACLNGRPLDRDLARALGREVRVANDANCFALSEATDGAGADGSIVFGVIAGTGTGGGVVVRVGEAWRVLGGANAIAGEWGHVPLPWPRDDERPGPACYCGRAGCVETFLSGPGLAADHARITGETLDGPSIARGETDATRATLARHADRFARSLAVVIDVLDPDVIVLGGGVGRMSHLYEAIPALWPRYVFSDVVRTRLVPPVHGDSSGVRGAAWLWP